MASDNLTEWVAIVISVVALAESVLTRRQMRIQEARAQILKEQQEYRLLYENFLLQMHTSLARSRKGFEKLRSGLSETARLEQYPGRLREFFEGLSDDRRVYWQVQIDQLHQHNERTIGLIDSHASGSRLSRRFQDGCEDFRDHAKTWKAMWDRIEDLSIPMSGLPNTIAEPFPSDFDQVVEDEIKRVQGLAGLAGPKVGHEPLAAS